MQRRFELVSDYQPAGDQPEAIFGLKSGLEAHLRYQTLLGVTGSGKTYTIAQLIAQTQRPTLIMAPNKTLAAQLYREMKDFFPGNAVEYFVSYYDYYQPEAYVPTRDLYIEKDASINDQIEQMRLCATRSLVERTDVIIVSTVSAIYGLGDPRAYMAMIFPFRVYEKIGFKAFLDRLVDLQYMRNDVVLKRGHFRVRGEIVEVTPAESENKTLRIQFDGDEIESLEWIHPLSLEKIERVQYATLYPENHYVTPYDSVIMAIDKIGHELKEQLIVLRSQNKLVEASRLEHRTLQDIEFLRETGHCQGIENYSIYLNNLERHSTPTTLIDYLPDNALIILDESHLMLSQISAMYYGDRSRKQTLVDYGFRLPSCLDNRPLMFSEFEKIHLQQIFVSATPSAYELEQSQNIVEQIVRPTGLLDPTIEIINVSYQVSDACERILEAKKKKQGVLITTLTKKMAEDLSQYFPQFGIEAQYLHSELDASSRVAAIYALRKGEIDVLIGINLLREGLDMPEVALVLIFDADKEGFLRSHRSLIQTIGRAARNVHGHVVFYADRVTKAMQSAIDETHRRREKQIAYNQLHRIEPQTICKVKKALIEGLSDDENIVNPAITEQKTYKAFKTHDERELKKMILQFDRLMKKAADALEFEQAASYRDQKIAVLNQLDALKKG